MAIDVGGACRRWLVLQILETPDIAGIHHAGNDPRFARNDQWLVQSFSPSSQKRLHLLHLTRKGSSKFQSINFIQTALTTSETASSCLWSMLFSKVRSITGHAIQRIWNLFYVPAASNFAQDIAANQGLACKAIKYFPITSQLKCMVTQHKHIVWRLKVCRKQWCTNEKYR